MVSAHTLPENLRYQIIKDRHDNDAYPPYISELAGTQNSHSLQAIAW
jgi:hypothetical protein